MDEGGKNRSGERTRSERPFRMPLHANDEVILRVKLHTFNDPVCGTYRRNAQVVARYVQGLVMAGVDLHFAGIRSNGGQPRTRSDADRVSFNYIPSGAVIDSGLPCTSQILDERSILPDI
jgi:hypothetical protein